jgi:heat shock protein HtpX
VRRRAIGRSTTLTLRMVTVVALVLAVYAGIAAGIVVAIATAPGWALYASPIAVLIVASAFFHTFGAERLILGSLGLSTEQAPPELRARLTRLAAMADVPVPRLEIAASREANAFAVGMRRSSGLIVVTSALLERLGNDELDAVLAHELSHIANRDAAVMTFAAVPRALGSVIVGQSSESEFYLWWFIWPLGLPLLAFGTLLTLAISRTREFAADRGSALLTGRPEALMSALVKLSGTAAPRRGDLRTIEAFCIVAPSTRHRALLMDHPPLEQRLAALAEIAR